MPASSSSLTITSKSTVYPSAAAAAAADSLKLSVSDLPMLSCHYIQKGVLLSDPPLLTFSDLALLLKRALSLTLSHFPALAGRLSTDPLGHVHILCNDAGVDFIEAKAKHLTVRGVLSPDKDVPDCVKQFFAFDRTVSYNGHFLPLLAVQVTELADGVFVGCTVNHAVTDGTSFWHFFNTFAEAARGSKRPSNSPDFRRDNVFVSPSAVLRLPAGGPAATFSQDEPLRERIFHFSRAAILKMKSVANSAGVSPAVAEIMGKQSHDGLRAGNGKVSPSPNARAPTEISSFQSLCGQLWRSVTRARKLAPSKTATFRMAVNCRHRLEPRLEPYYFGNAIQSIPTVASAAELLSRDLGWCAGLLHRNVVAHGDATVRRGVEGWEREPRLFPLGNFDGASITMGSSPRFPMYENDFGWGRPLAVRSGRANKFDGKISAFPGREGGGSVDLEVMLAPDTMAGLENDVEFMQYVSSIE
ncbi:BAHD acyltransferase DCR [Syzygium oleosum]|uniref:BAHD acyltransferase DCR n=1 Tax=Syzygium oleosum TaxID=219896 RepID=UPI0011D1BE2F|nr:BAHD acyltransferase DCR [Syzygium oleosum]